VHPAYKPLFGATAYLDDDAAIDKTKAHAREEVRGYFEILDAQLANQDWLADTRSIADAYLFVLLMWAGFVKVDTAGLNNLQRFEQRMKADDGVQRALKEQKLG